MAILNIGTVSEDDFEVQAEKSVYHPGIITGPASKTFFILAMYAHAC